MDAYQELLKKQQHELEQLNRFLKCLRYFVPFSFSLQQNIKQTINEKKNFQLYLYLQDEIQELYTYFDQYLNDVASLFRKYEVTHPFMIAILCGAILDRGFFSQGDSFTYQSIDFKNDLPILYAPRIMSGVGVCRHVSSFFREFTDTMHLSSQVMYGVVGNQWQSKKKASQKKERHAINCIQINGKKMAWDLTTKRQYFFKSNHRLESLKGSRNFYIEEYPGLLQKQIDEIETLPFLSKDEFYKEIKVISQRKVKLGFYRELVQLHEQAKPQLEKICIIEEKYTEPEICKAKFWQKK